MTQTSAVASRPGQMVTYCWRVWTSSALFFRRNVFILNTHSKRINVNFIISVNLIISTAVEQQIPRGCFSFILQVIVTPFKGLLLCIWKCRSHCFLYKLATACWYFQRLLLKPHDAAKRLGQVNMAANIVWKADLWTGLEYAAKWDVSTIAIDSYSIS